MNADIIGGFLSELRKQKGLKQREVAEVLHVSDKAISRWETGKGIPDICSLQGLSNFYEVSINEILEGRYVKENEVREIADKNIKNLIKQKFLLKKKFVIVIAICITLLTLITLMFMPKSVYGIGYSSCEGKPYMDAVFRDAANLEEAGVEYSVFLNPDEKSVRIDIKDYKKYADYIKKKYQ